MLLIARAVVKPAVKFLLSVKHPLVAVRRKIARTAIR
jgi:hypothetical protein